MKARLQRERVIYSSIPTLMKESKVMQEAHLSALSAKHSLIDQKIAAEIRRPLPDQSLLATLKKQKLRLKEEIVR